MLGGVFIDAVCDSWFLYISIYREGEKANIYKGVVVDYCMVSHEETRKLRIAMIRKTMTKAGKKNDIEKLVATCCAEWGTSRKTILEYIKMIGLTDV